MDYNKRLDDAKDIAHQIIDFEARNMERTLNRRLEGFKKFLDWNYQTIITNQWCRLNAGRITMPSVTSRELSYIDGLVTGFRRPNKYDDPDYNPEFIPKLKI